MLSVNVSELCEIEFAMSEAACDGRFDCADSSGLDYGSHGFYNWHRCDPALVLSSKMSYRDVDLYDYCGSDFNPELSTSSQIPTMLVGGCCTSRTLTRRCNGHECAHCKDTGRFLRGWNKGNVCLCLNEWEGVVGLMFAECNESRLECCS